MKKALAVMVVACLAVGLMLVGCGAQKASTSQEAIQVANGMGTVQEKTDYLVGQARDFYNSKEFQGAVEIAQYVLSYLDNDSAAAKQLLQQAQEGLTSQVKQAAGDAKKSFAGFGK